MCTNFPDNRVRKNTSLVFLKQVRKSRKAKIGYPHHEAMLLHYLLTFKQCKCMYFMQMLNIGKLVLMNASCIAV